MIKHLSNFILYKLWKPLCVIPDLDDVSNMHICIRLIYTTDFIYDYDFIFIRLILEQISSGQFIF